MIAPAPAVLAVRPPYRTASHPDNMAPCLSTLALAIFLAAAIAGQTNRNSNADFEGDARQQDEAERKDREDLAQKLDRFMKSGIIAKIDAAPGGKDDKAVYVGENFQKLSIDDKNFVLRVVAALYGERRRPLPYLEVYDARSATRLGSFTSGSGFSYSR
ncbi:MAG TPA: hypothetical protein VMT22_22035 [Terriglobales bacterium]|jgi:hypothetical protein|nr:hypothetical protein [Terriglobales bacterium]